MKKGMMLALLALAVTAVPAFAADESPSGRADMKHMMQMHPEMKQQMMQSPQHMMAMAYHKNLVNFAMVLKRAAQKSDTVPRDFARAAITEMRRSADQMEIYQEGAIRSMPADQKELQGEMTKTMGAHLAEMRGELAQLDTLAKGDRVDSREVLKHLQKIFQGCEGMCREGGMGHNGMEGMHGKGRHRDCMKGGGMKEGGMRDCMQGDRMHGDCMQGDCMHGDCMQGDRMHGDCMHCNKMGGAGMGMGKEGWQEFAQQRSKMMEMMKAQDAELAKMVEALNRAPQDQKQGIMADILTRMVKQRAELDAQLEKVQENIKHHLQNKPMSHRSREGMGGTGDGAAYDGGSNSSYMNSDSETDDEDMDMSGMHMQ